MRAIDDLALDLASGRTTSRQLIEDALARIETGEGPRAFIKTHSKIGRAHV